MIDKYFHFSLWIFFIILTNGDILKLHILSHLIIQLFIYFINQINNNILF